MIIILYTVRLIPYDTKHKWKHYKNLINHIKRSKNSVMTNDFIWFVELEEIPLNKILDLYVTFLEPKDKLQIEITKDIYSINIYKRSTKQL